jgi:hypothetical protein
MNTPTSGPNKYRREDDELRALLKSALPPVDDARHRDLWPQMLARLESPPLLASRTNGVPWLDWILAAAALALMLLFPGVLPMLLFHL